jgi:riboflavin synthase
MFTGIIEDKGKVLRVEYRGLEKRLTLEMPKDLTGLHSGDSINVNGVCLTVVELQGRQIVLDLSQETLQKTVLSELREGDQVNLEKALRLSDRLGGHLVTGHTDGIGVITEKRKERDFINLKIRVPSQVSKYIVPKGSISVDGISLTVNSLEAEEIRITVIPYTLEKTTLIDKNVGDRVNVEADILGKYVEKFLDRKGDTPKALTLSFLKEHGYIEEE